MSRTLTIILETTGRRGGVLGRGDDVSIRQDQIDAMKAQGLRGWVAIEAGDYYGKKAPELARVHAVNGATDGEWDAAVAAYQAARVR